MTLVEKDFTLRASSNHELKEVSFRHPWALLGLVASVVVVAGCGGPCRGHRQCQSRAIHSASYKPVPSADQPSCSQPTVMPLLQAEEGMQADQALLGGSGLAPSEPYSGEPYSSEPYPSEPRVDVAPLPQEWTQPIEENEVRPSIEALPDTRELEEVGGSDPMEI